jgi:glycine cleavage system H protein
VWKGVGQVEFPDELKYTKEHEWALDEGGGRFRIGITDYAQDALGDVVYVDVPESGVDVKAGEPFGEVESTKSVSDVYSPLTGKVVERNPLLLERPELVNEDPYGEGWMVIVQAAGPEETADLMSAGEYRSFVEQEQNE